LLNDLKSANPVEFIHVTLTLNIDEALSFNSKTYPFPIDIIINSVPKGFGANHNEAFHLHQKDSTFFCVVNPDIRVFKNPFSALIASMEHTAVGLAAPLVVNQNGVTEDSARFYPTPFKILCKTFGRCKGSDYAVGKEYIFPDWVGGMFMLFKKETFEQLNGFNERYFLYYEDVDLCARLKLMGGELALCPTAQVVHNAQRSSHSSLKYLKWHVSSMLRFFCSKVFLLIFLRKFKAIFTKGSSS
jgi:hypothetical protein